jgi:osmotically-inducible protein OsmY
MKRVATLLAVAGTLVMGAASASLAQVPDTELTVKARIALMTTEGVNPAELNVDASNGSITLHGAVESQPEKLQAESVVKSVDGVKEVKNLLHVVPPSSAPLVEARDEDLRIQVELALRQTPLVADSGIIAASVHKGVVLLTGRATSLQALLRAIEVIKDLRGVRRVSSDVVAE